MKITLASIILLSGIILSTRQSLAHGGGCRKDSLPGQCCHMDHKTGVFHCH